MSKIDKQLKYFVKALLKYAEKDEHHFNPGFTTEQIPTIFEGWGELEFNKVHHDAGKGCCIFVGPDCYSINVAHCNELQRKFNESRRSKLRLYLTVISIIVAIALFLLKQSWDNHQENQKTNNKVNIHVEPPKK